MAKALPRWTLPAPRDSVMGTFENRIGSRETRQGRQAERTKEKSLVNFRGQGYGIRLPNVFVVETYVRKRTTKTFAFESCVPLIGTFFSSSSMKRHSVDF